MKLNEVFDPEDDQKIPALRKRKAAEHLINKNRGDIKKWKRIYKENNPRDIYKLKLKPLIDKQTRPITQDDLEMVRDDRRVLRKVLEDICSSKFRHPEVESELISNPAITPYYLVDYAVNAIGGRWPEAEHAILTKRSADKMALWSAAGAIAQYAVYCLKGAWPAGEPILMSAVEEATATVAHYDWMVYRGQWTALQQYISKNVPDPNRRRELVKQYRDIMDHLKKHNTPL